MHGCHQYNLYNGRELELPVPTDAYCIFILKLGSQSPKGMLGRSTKVVQAKKVSTTDKPGKVKGTNNKRNEADE